ncbi:hypothetical protein BKA60DRAFT_636057 [Fusarium oxysporum]|nr:hypothetical protein BKA60DRAFT_636057 [Fusarium oxysporum]
MPPRSSREGQIKRPHDGAHDDQPASKSARTNEAPQEQQAESSQVRKGSRKPRILRGPKGEVMIPEDLPKECFWAKLKCAYGRNPLHFLSEFDPLISLDGTPDYEITCADDWDLMCLPIPGYEDGKFCGEFEDDDEEEGDGETANNAGKENDEKPFKKLESLHPNWPWVFAMRGVAQFDSVFQPNSSYRDFWSEVEGLAMILQRGQLDLNIVKH